MPRNPTCQLCPLHSSTVTTCVWGEWRGADHEPVPAPRYVTSEMRGVMIVGEAPGNQEDVAGRPFVGPTMTKLKTGLERVGFKQPYYITNVAKCYPSATKTPSTTEMAACRPYLEEELREVQPNWILALGASAWHRFGQGPITEHAGKEVWSDKYQAWIMPALHPAAILRDPNRESAWLADLGRFVALCEGRLKDKPDVHTFLARSLVEVQDLRDILFFSKGFTFDFETKPVAWWRKDWEALTIAFCADGVNAYVVPLQEEWSQQAVDLLKHTMAKPDLPKTAHNCLFDDLCWYRLAGELPYTTCDTMIVAQLLDENRLKGLKWLGRTLLGWPEWDIGVRNIPLRPEDEARLADFDARLKEAQRTSVKFDAETLARRREELLALRAERKAFKEVAEARRRWDDDTLASYNGMDVAATYLLRERLLPELQENEPLWRYFVQIEMPKLRALERLMVNGVYVDVHTLKNHWQIAELQKAEAAARLPIENPGSTKQVAKWLYEDLKLPILKHTPSGNPSTDEETIKRLASTRPAAKMLLDWRRPAKNISTYLSPVAADIEASFDGRAHYEYRAGMVETGRLSSRFHTTPRDPFVRAIFSAPPGRVLLQPDFAQIEARLAAWAAAGKPWRLDQVSPETMMTTFARGIDVYCETAGAVLNKPPAEVTRDKADPNSERQIVGKVPTLSMLYRISPQGLQHYVWKDFELDWSLQYATLVHTSFYRRWPEFQMWHDREATIIANRGYAVSELGRLRRLPAAQGYGLAAHEAINSGINHPIQSLASDFTQIAMITLDRMIQAGLCAVHTPLLVGNVHDQLIAEVDEAGAFEFARAMKLVMQNVHRIAGVALPDGLLEVEMLVGPWGAGKEIAC